MGKLQKYAIFSFKILVTLSVYGCKCVRACVRACVHVCDLNAEASFEGCFPGQALSLVPFETRSLIDLVLTREARLAG